LSTLLDRFNNSRIIKEEYKGLLLVSQPKTPRQSRLPGTTKEAQLITEQLKEGVPRVMCLDDDAATMERVVSEMQSHSCIHLACHAMQYANPVGSGFYLHDGCLELTEIIKRQFPIADLAFLSACQTSTGVNFLSEEAVHLAAGMLAAGYRGVVATMWSIKDRYGPLVAEDFYRELRKHQTSGGSKPEGISSQGAASALHHATKKLRESLDDSESSLLTWVPYVHFGL
jgi:CHAT domain-containing protein